MGSKGRARRIAAASLAAAALAACVWAGIGFGVWTPLQVPERIDLCGQRYTRFAEPSLTWAETLAKDDQATEAIVLESVVGTLPIIVDQPARYRPGAGYNGCGHLILLHLGPDRYVRFYKLGGP